MRLQFLEDGYFSHSCRWDSFILIFEFDFLEGHSLLAVSIPGFEDNPIGALANPFHAFVPVLFVHANVL